jgi:hypothetical protein
MSRPGSVPSSSRSTSDLTVLFGYGLSTTTLPLETYLVARYLAEVLSCTSATIELERIAAFCKVWGLLLYDCVTSTLS